MTCMTANKAAAGTVPAALPLFRDPDSMLRAERLGHFFARAGVKLPEVLDPPPRQPLLKHRQMRIPAAAEVLRTRPADNSAVGQDKSRLRAFRRQFVGHRPVLAALECRLEQVRRIEADYSLRPDSAFHFRIALRSG